MKDKAHITLDTFWPYQVTVLADEVSRYTMSIVKTVVDLNQSQWRVLAAVADKPGSTAAQVTALTPMDKTIVSRAVQSLIEAGYIKKSADAFDKRRLSLRSTPKGRACYEAVATKLNAAMQAPFADAMSPDELVQMIKAFREKLANLTPIEAAHEDAREPARRAS
ncbi:MAG: MarR family winged helix-turn-helix transcriptional regulator [Pseudomonadota bacterium]